MKNKIIFVDFDRTLLDTPRFMQQVWQKLSEKYHVNATTEFARLKNYYVMQGDLGYYDFARHIKSTTGAEKAVVLPYLEEALAGLNFCYDDTEYAFSWRLQHEVRILTYGEAWFQRFKLSFVPELQQLPIDIVLEPKRQFIAAHHAGRAGWLVDDRPGQQLPSGFTEIWLDRISPLPITYKDGMIVVNSLKVVGELL